MNTQYRRDFARLVYTLPSGETNSGCVHAGETESLVTAQSAESNAEVPN